MKNIKLFIITSLFASFLIGCGMKGPLYQAPVKDKGQDNNATAAKEQVTDCSDSPIENKRLTDKQNKTENK